MKLTLNSIRLVSCILTLRKTTILTELHVSTSHCLTPLLDNFSLTERESRNGEYWPEVLAVRREQASLARSLI